VTRRIVFRATGLVLFACAIVAGLTVYFSSEKVPPCLLSGIPVWKAPTDHSAHHFEVVVPDRALCFFDMDDEHHLVGYLKLPHIEGVNAIQPRTGSLALRYGNGRGALVDLQDGNIQYGVTPPPAPRDQVVVPDLRSGVEYVTRRGELGFRVYRLDTHALVQTVTFEGFTWNRRFGPNPPDHGLSLAPDRPELWVLDAPNNAIHVFDVSGATPEPITDLRLTRPLTGDESPCARVRCGRLGWLQHSADGRFVYVGDSGDVFDAHTREEIANLEPLHESRLTIEVDWVNGVPVFPAAG
jgi:hypothetical protein